MMFAHSKFTLERNEMLLSRSSLKDGAVIQYMPKPMEAIVVSNDNAEAIILWVAARGGEAEIEVPEGRYNFSKIKGVISSSSSPYPIDFEEDEIIAYVDGCFKIMYFDAISKVCEIVKN